MFLNRKLLLQALIMIKIIATYQCSVYLFFECAWTKQFRSEQSAFELKGCTAAHHQQNQQERGSIKVYKTQPKG